MSRTTIVQECDQEVHALLPDLPRPEQKALATLVSGVVLGQSCCLSAASAATPGAARDRSKQRRAQRLLANTRLEVARAQRRLLARVLRGRRGRLDLLLDAVTTGATTHQAGTVTLTLALAWHGRALPLVWRTWRADQPKQDWTGALPDLFARVQALLPATVQVVLLADRGLSHASLARAAQAVGWHFLLRLTRTGLVRVADGTVGAVAALVPEAGREGCWTGVRLWAPRTKGWHRWIAHWESALTLNVVGRWRLGDKDPWLLATDLPARFARCAEYRRRTWEEELFRDLKRFGWQWQQSRVRQPARVERLLLVVVLATLWMLALGRVVLRRGWRPQLEERSRRCYSRFQLGLRWVRRCLATEQHVLVTFQLGSEPTAPIILS